MSGREPASDDRAAADFRAVYREAVREALATIAAIGRFDPFSIRLSADGATRREVAETALPERTQATRLYSTLFVAAAEESLVCFALVRPVEMTHRDVGAVHAALAIDMEHRDAPPVTIYAMYAATDASGDELEVVRAIPTNGERVVFAEPAG